MMRIRAHYLALAVFGIIFLIISWQLSAGGEDGRPDTDLQLILAQSLSDLPQGQSMSDADLSHGDVGLLDVIRKSHPLNIKAGVTGHLMEQPRGNHTAHADSVPTNDRNVAKIVPTPTNKDSNEASDSVVKDLRSENTSVDGFRVRTTGNDTKSSVLQFDMMSMVRFDLQPYRAHWVHVDAPLTHRLRMYNAAISHLRADIKQARGFRAWSDPPPDPVVLWGSRDDFLQQLSDFTAIRTVALAWLHTADGFSDDRNLMIQAYYTWTASEPLCEWIKTRAFTKARYDAVYNRSCTSDIREGASARPLEPVYLHGKPINPNHYWPNNGDSFPSDFYTSPPPHVLYMQIAEDAIITDVGDVYSGKLKVVPYSCSHDLTPTKPSGYSHTTIYTEVFVISGHWGSAHFHKSVELFPRVAPYLDFLTRHTDIMIQVSEARERTAQVLDILGIHKDRLVTGTIRAKIVYLPQGTPCGFAQVQGLQVLSGLYRDRARELASDAKPGNRTSLVMIHRSGQRRLSEALHIELLMRNVAQDYGLIFNLYHDQQLPSYDETIVLFNQAVMVVAPHGAGESNLLFCEPGTFVVEAVCNPPHVNLCYQRISYVLGLRYHGIPSEEGCEDHIKVNPKVIEFVVRAKLEIWKSMRIMK